MRRLRMRFDCASLVLVGGKAVGMLKVDRNSGEWHLIQIVLAPEAQGQGLGSRLIRSVMAEAHAQGASLHLSVLKYNPAMRLYQRLGFTVAAEEPFAFVMRLEAPRPSA